MAWAMELSPAGFDAMLADLSYMDRKTGRAYLQLVGYLRRFGSVPSGERALASVLNVTVRFLRDVAWPLLEDRLVLSEDHQRYFDPDITAANPRRAAGAPGHQEKSKQHQEAARTRHARARAEAEAHAERMKTAAEAHTNSMRGASETHAQTDANASSDASDASPGAGANSLSLQEVSVVQPIEVERLSERESSRPSASDVTPDDAATHARTHENHAQTHAKSHAESNRPIRPTVRPIWPDWRPTEELMAQALLIRADAAIQVQKFINLNTGLGKLAADWGPLFLRFLEHANEYEARRGLQPSLSVGPVVIKGGKVESQSEAPETEEPILGTGIDAQWARAARKLKGEIGAGVYRTWFSKAAFVGIEDGEAIISLPTKFIRDYVRSNYLDRLLAHWRVEDPKIRINLAEATERREATGG
jgi:hypothetical protein